MYTFALKHRSKNAKANANADVLSRLLLPATAEELHQPRYRLTGSSDLDVYFVGASGINPSRLRTPSDSSLGGLANASGGLANVLCGLAATPDGVFFVGGGGSACAKQYGQQVWRAASKRFLTKDEAQHEQWKAIQAVHPHLAWASQDKERSTEGLLDDDSPLVQPTIHTVVEGQLGPGLLVSACPLTREGIGLLQQTQGAISAVTRSVTRKRDRPFRNKTRMTRNTMHGLAESIISPANSPGTERKDEVASSSRATETCDENDEGLDSAAAIIDFRNLLCEKKPIDWCE